MMIRKQRGVAVITAMVITAIAISIAATLVYKQQFSIRLAGNINTMEQAYLLVKGMEEIAFSALREDRLGPNRNNYDSYDEAWATPVTVPLSIEGVDAGLASGQLFDLQSGINVNDLLLTTPANSSARQPQIRPEYRDFLTRLASYYQITPNTRLVDTLADWLDSDDATRTDGAESSAYQTQTLPHVAANGDMVSRSELAMLDGMQEEVYLPNGETDIVHKVLAPALTCLPLARQGSAWTLYNPGQQTQTQPQAVTAKINVNTAPYEVLYALGLNDVQVADALDDRPFDNVSDFKGSVSIHTATPISNQIDALVDVESSYFQLKGKIEVGNVRLFVNSTIHLPANNRPRVIRREFSEQG